MEKKKIDKSKSKAQQQSDKPQTTYLLQNGFDYKCETRDSDENPPEWFKPISAYFIAYSVLELADWIETVGEKKSTLNKIDALRKAIVFTTANQTNIKCQDEQVDLKQTEIHDLLLQILQEITPYYKSRNKKPVLNESVEKLRKVAKQLQKYNSEFNEDLPLKTVTDEMRNLADYIAHCNYPDIYLQGWASSISFMLSTIYGGMLNTRGQHIKGDQEIWSCIIQAKDKIENFANERYWPKDENEKQSFKNSISKDLWNYADRLDRKLGGQKDNSAIPKNQVDVQTSKSESPGGADGKTKKFIYNKEPTKDAIQAYQLYDATGKTQAEVAEIMTQKLKKPVNQGQVSRWVTQYENWAKPQGIIGDDIKPKIIVNSDILEIGTRTDGKITGDPRHAKH